MKKSMLNSNFLYILFFIIIPGCKGQILPANSFVFNKQFDSLFKSFNSYDTIYFENNVNNVDTFVLIKTDSVIADRINCFMCARPAKHIVRNYKQLRPSFQSQNNNDSTSFFHGDLSVGISIYPDSNLNTAHILLKNFWNYTEQNLGSPSNDTLLIGSRKFINYYIFTSTAPTLETEAKDVNSVFISLTDGILAYKEKSGILRRRIIK